jgi:hypothetical protein
MRPDNPINSSHIVSVPTPRKYIDAGNKIMRREAKVRKRKERKVKTFFRWLVIRIKAVLNS